ncbi:MAG TPA: hypothetical protein VL099_03440 [Candidatus Binatia bacterium]|nr:hypothetical protein [Candidatus Binatia bacterium]
MKKGLQYLLFARRFEGRLEIGNGGHSDFLEKSAAAISQIERIRKTKSGGEIAGRIGWGDTADFQGVRIRAAGNKHTYEALTDNLGWFHISVPEGTYRVRAGTTDDEFVPFELSYDDPDHIVVHPGGCPQMQFMPTESYRPNRPGPKPG